MSIPSIASAVFALVLAVPVLRDAPSTPTRREQATAASPRQEAPVPVRARVYVEIPPQSLSTYAYLAHDVVWARVVGLRTEPWRDLAVTVVTLDVLGNTKNRVGGRIEVRVLGGELPTGRIIVDEAPSFTVGDEVVLFLASQPHTGELSILGLRQGTYRVKDENGEPSVFGLHAHGEHLLDFLTHTIELAASPRIR